MEFKLTTKQMEQAISEAIELANEERKAYITPEMIIYKMLSNEDSLLNDLMRKNEFDTNALKTALEKNIAKIPALESLDLYPEISQEMKMLIEYAYDLMSENQDKYLSFDIFLIAVLESNLAVRRIIESFIDSDNLILDIKAIRGNMKITSRSFNESGYLTTYGRNLTKLAENGEIQPVFGRVDEIESMANILTKKTKNNPILIGEPGVGKTAIVEGLAHRIVSGDVQNLLNFDLWEIDLTAVCSCKDSAKARMQGIIEEVKHKEANGQNIILFIDEIHRVPTSPAGLADVLKPALARGELRTIGATTLKEYQKHFEKDAAFQRRFQKVMIDEPSEEEALYILKKIAPKYAQFHDVIIPDEVLVKAVSLSKRYITDRRLPDKAIDLMDEATSQVGNSRYNIPREIKNLKKEVESLELKIQLVERTIGLSESETFKERQYSEIEKLKEELILKKEELQRENDTFAEKVQTRKNALKLMEALSNAKTELKSKLMQREIDEAIELQKMVIPELENQVNELMQHFEDITVTEIDVMEVIEKWTGIPVSEMSQDEKETIKNLDNLLSERIQGQDEAIQAVARVIKRSRAGLTDPKKPVGSFMFLGPTGVGKTETVKAVAEHLFGDEGSIVRLDMSEYQEAHTVSKLIGSPSGYVGHEDGGNLTNAIKNKPYSIILFDEIEKAHPKVFDVLLQVLDDGRLTDGKGMTVDFKNTVIVFTSNIGGIDLAKIPNSVVRKKEALYKLSEVYRPEFLNRIDDIVVFNPLDMEAVAQILKNRVDALAEKLWEDRFLELIVSDAALGHILGSVDIETFGARPINRKVATDIEDKVTDLILNEEVGYGSRIIIDFDRENKKYIVHVEN